MKFPKQTSKQKRRYGRYRCYCGKEFETQKQSVNSLLVKSCGCALKSLICGVGVNDADYQIENKIDGERVVCPFYGKWTNMLKRAYSEKLHKRFPTYKDVTVCKEWHLFSNFKKWMEAQDWENKELDKDILYPNNKIYSPKTCCFVSRDLNTLLNDNSRARGEYPQGVSLRKDIGKFQSIISRDNKMKRLGYFNTSEKASQAYLLAKIEYIKTFFNKASKEVRVGLLKHIEIIRAELDTIQ